MSKFKQYQKDLVCQLGEKIDLTAPQPTGSGYTSIHMIAAHLKREKKLKEEELQKIEQDVLDEHCGEPHIPIGELS